MQSHQEDAHSRPADSDSSSSRGDTFYLEKYANAGLATWGLSEAIEATNDLENLVASYSSSEIDDEEAVDIVPKASSALSSLPLSSVSCATPVIGDASDLFTELQEVEFGWLDCEPAKSLTIEALDALPSTEELPSLEELVLATLPLFSDPMWPGLDFGPDLFVPLNCVLESAAINIH